MFEINKGVLRPEAPAQLVASNDRARLFKKSSQNLEGLCLEPDPQAALTENTFLEVNFEGSEVNDASFWIIRLHGA
jgi:hypothetical protein